MEEVSSSSVPELGFQSNEWHFQVHAMVATLGVLLTRIGQHLLTPVREASISCQMSGEDIGQLMASGVSSNFESSV